MNYYISWFMSHFCLLPFFYFFFIHLCLIYTAKQHLKFLLNFPVSCYCCFESDSPDSKSDCKLSLLVFLSHARLFLFQLGSFIYLSVDTCSSSAFTLSFPLFLQIFHATNLLAFSTSKKMQSSEISTKLWPCTKEQSSLCSSLFLQLFRQSCLPVKILVLFLNLIYPCPLY